MLHPHAGPAPVAFAPDSTGAMIAAIDLFAAAHFVAVLVLALLPVLLLGVAITTRRRRARWIAGGAVMLLAGVATDAFLIEPRWLELTLIEHPARGLTRPLRIALLADLQTDRPGAWEERVLRRALGTRPDLVLLAGDLIQLDHHDPPERLAAAQDEMARILRGARVTARLGAYAVRGNIDRAGRWRRALVATGVTAIEQTTRIDVGPVVLTCLSLEDSFDPGLELEAEDRPHLVLGHAPDFALAHPPAELLLAGHTHGGQVRLPGIGPLLTFSAVPRSWAAGATRLDDRSLLVVSRGIGMERGAAPRLRFGCRPQIVIIDLIPAPGARAGPGTGRPASEH